MVSDGSDDHHSGLGDAGDDHHGGHCDASDDHSGAHDDRSDDHLSSHGNSCVCMCFASCAKVLTLCGCLYVWPVL